MGNVKRRENYSKSPLLVCEPRDEPWGHIAHGKKDLVVAIPPFNVWPINDRATRNVLQS